AAANPRSVPRHRSAVGRADPRSQAARPARRHAGDLGRRVRPHRLLPGHAHRRQLRPRPPPALLHLLAGGPRPQTPPPPPRRPPPPACGSANPRPFPTTSPPIPSPSTICTPPCCPSWASIIGG